jgi:cytosine/adenosine deaminase-related metal-dependent hydrolase
MPTATAWSTASLHYSGSLTSAIPDSRHATLLTGDWVVPVSRRPIRDGGVVVNGEHIVAIGPSVELARAWPEAKAAPFPECVLMPGLVNAHTHLGLSAVEGLFEPGPFTDWLPKLVDAMKTWSTADYAASTAVGAARCLKAGVTAVGDISYGSESVFAAARTGLGGTFFFEVLGIAPAALRARLDQLGFVPRQDCGPRIRCGLSPHTLYSSGPELLVAVTELAREVEAPLVIHVAETVAEVDLLRDGSGALAPVAAKLAHGFEPTGEHPVAYLDRLGVLDGATAVHVCQTWPSDIGRLSATARGVVTCPRSNEWLHNGIAPVDRLLQAGVPVGIGTDSLASTPDLDLFEEARALQARFPSLTARTIVEMLTVQGALALGMEERFGVLEPGMQADITVFKIAGADEPETALVMHAGRERVEAVMAGGEWVLQDGRLLVDVSAEQAVAASARERAEEALT